ncbi:MAG TPA: nuclear transport factor 2 family protein [Gemmatimonadaceae bacterium]|jgi:ketosteroid isomerase-like protein
MRPTLIALAIAGLVLPAARGAAQAGSSAAAVSPDARELFRLEDRWASALIERDAAFFARTLHPDYVYSDERGTFTKDQVIAEQIGTDTVKAAGNENMRAHVHGSAAVVTGILTVSGRGPEGPFSRRYRYTDTWLRQGSRWIMIASQDYEIPAR